MGDDDGTYIIDFRNWLADFLERQDMDVPHRGYATRTKEADIQVCSPDGVEIEVVMRVVER